MEEEVAEEVEEEVAEEVEEEVAEEAVEEVAEEVVGDELPIIDTPYEDDSTIRTASPTN